MFELKRFEAKPEVRGSDSSRLRTTLPGVAHGVPPPPLPSPLFVSWLGEADRRRQPGPKTVEGCSHVGSCFGDQQGGPQRCGPEEEEGTRRPGYGLPGHLQRCYDSGVCSVFPPANAAVLERGCVCALLSKTGLKKWSKIFLLQVYYYFLDCLSIYFKWLILETR